ncbi:MAG: hypothetical protein U9Q12_02575 [Patescibacteria group bacterium]|nr:hypothetical protein [Patescibacteria group bacterium]
MEKALKAEEVDIIYIVEYSSDCNGLKAGIGDYILVVNEKAETSEETLIRSIKKFGVKNELIGWQKEFFNYLSNEVLRDWQHYCSSESTSGGATYVSIMNYRLNELLKSFLRKKVPSSFYKFTSSLDDIPCCNEYKILIAGYTHGYGYDKRWVNEFILKSKKGKLARVEETKARIKKRKVEILATQRRLEKNIEEDLRNIEDLRKEVCKMEELFSR